MEQLLSWVCRFLKIAQPQQSNSGGGSVQARHLRGDVSIKNVTNHNHIHILALPNAPPPKHAQPAPQRKARPDQVQAFVKFKNLSEKQREYTTAMMLREFGTSTIIALEPAQISRVTAYMDACIKNRRNNIRNTRTKI